MLYPLCSTKQWCKKLDMTWLVVTSHAKHPQRYISLILKLLFQLQTVFCALITLLFKTCDHSCFLHRNYIRVLDTLYTFIGEKFRCKLFILMVPCSTLNNQECESKRILVCAKSTMCTLYHIGYFILDIELRLSVDIKGENNKLHNFWAHRKLFTLLKLI